MWRQADCKESLGFVLKSKKESFPDTLREKQIYFLHEVHSLCKGSHIKEERVQKQQI